MLFDNPVVITTNNNSTIYEENTSDVGMGNSDNVTQNFSIIEEDILPNYDFLENHEENYNENDNYDNTHQQPSNDEYFVSEHSAFPRLQQQQQQQIPHPAIDTTTTIMNYFPNMVTTTISTTQPSYSLIHNDYLLTSRQILSPDIPSTIPITTPIISSLPTTTTTSRSRSSRTRSSSFPTLTSTTIPPQNHYYDQDHLTKMTKMTDEEKRRRNTLASARFRNKRKLREQELERLAAEMTERAKFFESKAKDLEKEVRLLRSLIIEKKSKLSTNLNYGNNNNNNNNNNNKHPNRNRNKQSSITTNTTINDDYVDDNNNSGIGNSHGTTINTTDYNNNNNNNNGECVCVRGHNYSRLDNYSSGGEIDDCESRKD